MLPLLGPFGPQHMAQAKQDTFIFVTTPLTRRLRRCHCMQVPQFVAGWVFSVYCHMIAPLMIFWAYWSCEGQDDRARPWWVLQLGQKEYWRDCQASTPFLCAYLARLSQEAHSHAKCVARCPSQLPTEVSFRPAYCLLVVVYTLLVPSFLQLMDLALSILRFWFGLVHWIRWSASTMHCSTGSRSHWSSAFPSSHSSTTTCQCH